jgi:hypothetical protein
MLVVCNGAVKSGSTWLYNIVQELDEFDWPEARYLSHSNSKHPTIKQSCLAGFLAEVEFESKNIITKNHYGKVGHRELLLASPNTRILDMSRDARDVIVSAYYDRCRRSAFRGSFSEYYWQFGRPLVDNLRKYHDVWATLHPQIMTTSYEALKSDFKNEVSKIASFLDVKVDHQEIARIEKATTLESLRSNYKDDAQYNTKENSFFRKGEVGDWENHFDEKIKSDYRKISQHGIGKFDIPSIRSRIGGLFNNAYSR